MPDDVTQVRKLAGQTPSETLRAAAARLRALAAKATPGPWSSLDDGDRLIHVIGEHGDFEYVVDEPISNSSNAAWIAALSPVVAEPLARELEMHFVMLRTIEDLDGDRASMGHALAAERAGHMLAFACSILEQQP